MGKPMVEHRNGDGPPPLTDQDAPGAHRAPSRRLRLTKAAEIAPKPVRWTWEDRIPQGFITLTPGRGGLGKSTFHTWLIARLSRGELPGVHFGTPKASIIAATEDSWAHTIVPRLMAASADLDRVYRVDVVTEGNAELTITLPTDVGELERAIREVGAALVSVDPLLGTMSSGLDSHKNAEVRVALTPLSTMADRTGCAVLGNAHFNKSGGTDPMLLITGSGAFGDVARAAFGFVSDPDGDEDGACVISQIKNNLGRLDLPSLRYRIEGATIDTGDGPAEVGRLVWLGDSDRSVADILRDGGGGDRSELEAACEFLHDALQVPLPSIELDRLARGAGISVGTLKRARKRLNVKAAKTADGWLVTLPAPPDQGAQRAQGGQPARLAPLAPLPSSQACEGCCPQCGEPAPNLYGIEEPRTCLPCWHKNQAPTGQNGDSP